VSVGALVILAALVYTVFAVGTARSGGRIDASLGSFIFNGVGAVVALAVYLLQTYVRDVKPIATQSAGISYSVIAGIAIGTFSILFITIYGRGGNLSYVLPVIYGASIALSAAIGFLVFKEPVSVARIVGVGAIVVGIGFLATAS
jgi:uncharacterized membrane protein